MLSQSKEFHEYFSTDGTTKYDMPINECFQQKMTFVKYDGFCIAYFVNFNYVLSCWLYVGEDINKNPDYKCWLK